MSDEQDATIGGMPVFRWQEMAAYRPGPLVLVRADKSGPAKLAFREDGEWFEMVDGDGYPLGFEPVEWCVPPGGPAAWD